MRNPALPLIAAAVTMILWASAFIVIRSTGVHYSPGPLALGRLAAGSVALSLVAALRPRRLPRGRPLLLIIGYGVLWFGIYAILVNAAEHHLDAGTTALVVNVGPILIAVLAGIYLKEGFPRGLVTGLVIAFAGVATIAVATSTGRHDTLGVLLALGAAALYAVGVLLQKQALRDVDPFTATWLGCLAGTVACLPYAPGLLTELRHAPGSATLGVIYLGLFPTAIAFATWAYALKRMSAGSLSSSSYLVPGIAVLLSWLFLGEVPAALAFAGGALCLLGVAVTRLPPSASLLHILGNKSGPQARL
jgi:drug/metabolite transporter (DMT)-like permease